MNNYNSKPVIAVDYDETITDNTPYPLLGYGQPEKHLII